MLYLLTGDVQIGKTRWLEELVGALRMRGVTPYGVLAPGVWVESTSERANAQGLEKLGIDNVLLPSGTRLRFATRTDIAKSTGAYQEKSQAGQEGLGWHISDSALAEVNAYLKTIPELSAAVSEPGVLIIDELGRLELLRNQGLTEAMALLTQGPLPHLQDAILIVRDVLSNIAEERYADIWGGCERIAPSPEAFTMLVERLCS